VRRFREVNPAENICFNDFAAYKKKLLLKNETDFFLEFNRKNFSSSLFSPKHNLTLPEMPIEAIENIVHTWQKEYTVWVMLITLITFRF
jgi:UDPglucose--hexose-1-phosphate uridylyltransferase